MEEEAEDHDGDDGEVFALWQHKRVRHLIQEELAEILEGETTDGWARPSNGSRKQQRWRR